MPLPSNCNEKSKLQKNCQITEKIVELRKIRQITEKATKSQENCQIAIYRNQVNTKIIHTSMSTDWHLLEYI